MTADLKLSSENTQFTNADILKLMTRHNFDMSAPRHSPNIFDAKKFKNRASREGGGQNEVYRHRGQFDGYDVFG